MKKFEQLIRENSSYFFILPIIIVLELISFVGCKKDGDSILVSESDTILTGYVIDQVSMEPVAEANIYLGGLPFNESGMVLIPSEYKTKSDQQGEYKLKVPKNLLQSETIQNSTHYPYIYAAKDGYAGSSYCYYSTSDINPIQLFHISKLILRVWNDTINNDNDLFEFGLQGGSWISYPGYIGRSVMGRPVEIFICSGRKYDQIFEWYPLWGNGIYYFYSPPSINFQPVQKVQLIPDTTTYYTISF